MTWADDIEHALRRSKSPFSVTHVTRWLRTGQATMAVGDKMHASVVWWPDGTAEIAHLAGEWDNNDARWLFERMREAASARGITFVAVEGRKGWQRFLRMKGVHTDGSTW